MLTPTEYENHYLSSKAHEGLWVPYLHTAFPPKTSRSDIDARVGRLQDLRNRVAHHEQLLSTDLVARLEDLLWVAERLDPSLAHYISATTDIPSLNRSRPLSGGEYMRPSSATWPSAGANKVQTCLTPSGVATNARNVRPTETAALRRPHFALSDGRSVVNVRPLAESPILQGRLCPCLESSHLLARSSSTSAVCTPDAARRRSMWPSIGGLVEG
jgi:hypothetical protein